MKTNDYASREDGQVATSDWRERALAAEATVARLKQALIDKTTDSPATMPDGRPGLIYEAHGRWYVTADDESFDSGPHSDKAAALAALAAAWTQFAAGDRTAVC